jgi:glycosyltransferase
MVTDKIIMKVSVIVSVFNSEKTVSDAIDSILSQSYSNIECIVIDAESTDRTRSIIQDYGDKIDVFVTEPDNGIYDGLNKGILLATGDIIAFLHSDDVYADKAVVSDVVSLFGNDIQGVYGDLVYVDRVNTGKVFRYWRSGIFSTSLLNKGWMPPHPTLFLRSGIYQQYGIFDTSFKIAGDYDFMLRILKDDTTIKYLPKLLYKMRVGGESNRSIKNILYKTKEDLRAMRKNGIDKPFLALFYKNISKLIQLVKH